MKLKRFAAALLVFCLMLTFVPGGVSADAEPASGVGWDLNADGVLTVTMEQVSAGSAENWSAQASKIEKVVIGSGVKSVSGNAFAACDSLTAFEIEGENENLSVGDDGVLYNRDRDMILCYPAARAEDYFVPKTVASIQWGAFSGLISKGTGLKIYAYADTISSVATSGGASFPATAELIPYVPVTGVRLLSEEVLSLDIGETAELRAAVLPEDATFREVSWTTSNGYIASVEPKEPDADGNAVASVEGLRAGEVEITVTTADRAGKNFTASCTVMVEKRDVRELTLSPKPLTLKMGDTETLTATLTPIDATDKTVTFFSTDRDVVEVIGDGETPKDHVTHVAEGVTGSDSASAEVKVKAVGPGAASVVAITQDGGRYDVCGVVVPEVKLSVNELELRLDGTGTLYAEVLPGDLSVVWSSSDEEEAVVKVAQNGKTATITPVGTGRAMITASVTIGGVTVSDVCAVEVKAVATGITIEQDGRKVSALTMYYLEGYDSHTTLTATVTPEGAVNKTVIWASSDEDVATVSGGTVTAVGPGKASIVAVTEDGGLAASCVVTVWKPISEITLNKSVLTLTEGQEEALSAKVNEDADPGVTWSSDRPEIATVDEKTGVVHAVAAGEATITATSTANPTATAVTASCTVTVKAPAKPVTNVTLNKDTLELTEGESETLEATVVPDDADVTDVTWESTDEGVAEVDGDGNVTAINPGKATIIVTTKDGRYKAMCAVTVKAKTVEVTGVTISETALKLNVQESALLIATVTPSGATDWTVTWSSDRPEIATVDENGIVKALTPGTAKITAEAGGKTADCTVTVRYPADEVELNYYAMTLDAEDADKKTRELTATVKGHSENAHNQTVKWLSSDESVAELSTDSTESGGAVTVEAVGAGKASIIAVSEDGGVTAVCTVIVPKISLVGPATLPVDKTVTLTAVKTPADLGGTVAWSTSDNTIATVDSGGVVTGKKAGTATITATLEVYNEVGNNVTVSATYGITVDANKVTNISLEPATLTLDNGPDFLTATVVTSGTMETTPELDVEIENLDGGTEDVVKVESLDPGRSFKVTSLRPGTALITVSVVGAEDHKAACVVTVPAVPVRDISLDSGSKTLEKNKTFDLTATVSPGDATNKTVKWLSSDDSVATVEEGENGVATVTAVGAGTATIIAVSEDGGITKTCAVTVPSTVTDFQLDQTELTIYIGDTGNAANTVVLEPRFTPSDAPNQTVTWSSSDTDVATVDKGVVTAKKDGTAVITATAVDGGRTATCVVTVWNVTTEIELSKTTLTLAKGETWPLSAKVNPGANPAVEWKIVKNENNCITLTDGVVTAGETAGTATVQAVGADGRQYAECVITVPEFMVSDTVVAPTITIGESDGKRTVTLGLADGKEGDEIWYRTSEAPTYVKYEDPIPVENDFTIMACTRNGNYQSVVVTGYIFADRETSRAVLTDSMGNEINTLAEAVDGEDLAFWANITLSDEARANAESLYLAVYDTDGQLISLTSLEAVTGEGTESQVISEYFKVNIPEGKKIGSISLMVLSSDNVPVMSAETVGD